jgi:hypothetical protein
VNNASKTRKNALIFEILNINCKNLESNLIRKNPRCRFSIQKIQIHIKPRIIQNSKKSSYQNAIKKEI